MPLTWMDRLLEMLTRRRASQNSSSSPNDDGAAGDDPPEQNGRMVTIGIPSDDDEEQYLQAENNSDSYPSDVDDDEDDGEDEDYPGWRREKVPSDVDRSAGDNNMKDGSALKNRLKSLSFSHNRFNSFPRAIIEREMGLNHKQICIGSHIIPNQKQQLTRFEAKAFCGTFDQSGKRFLSAAQDAFIRIYDTSSGQFKPVKMITAQEVGWSILDVAISPSGQQFLYTSWSPGIRLCNIDHLSHSQHEVLHLEAINRNLGIFSVRFSPNGEEVIAGASDRCVYVYDLETKRQVHRIRAQENDVNAVCFADSSSNILISGGDEGILKAWDRRQLNEKRAKPVGLFAGHFDGITFIDAAEDGRHLISNSKDQTIKLWDLRSFSKREAMEESKATTLSDHWDYRWSPVPRRISQNRDRMHGDTSVMTYRGHVVRQTLIRCRFSPSFSTGQRYIYTGCASGSIHIYDVLTGDRVALLSKGHLQNCRDVSWHPFYPEIISSSWDGSIVKWFYSEREQVREIERPESGLSIPYYLRSRNRRSQQLLEAIADAIHM